MESFSWQNEEKESISGIKIFSIQQQFIKFSDDKIKVTFLPCKNFQLLFKYKISCRFYCDGKNDGSD